MERGHWGVKCIGYAPLVENKQTAPKCILDLSQDKKMIFIFFQEEYC
jgi:hypothetical protein